MQCIFAKYAVKYVPHITEYYLTMNEHLISQVFAPSLLQKKLLAKGDFKIGRGVHSAQSLP
jgi:hypothetical protein